MDTKISSSDYIFLFIVSGIFKAKNTKFHTVVVVVLVNKVLINVLPLRAFIDSKSSWFIQVTTVGLT